MSDMRRYMNLVESALFEAVNYEDMFNDVKKLLPLYDEPTQKKFSEALTTTINEARKVLKKNDRVVWFLRLYKVGILHDLASAPTAPGTTPEQMASIEEASDKALAALVNKSGVGRGPLVSDTLRVSQSTKSCLRDLGHYLSLPIAAIQNYVFSFEGYNQIIFKFRDIEREWQAATSELIPHDPDDGEIVIKFPDGWFWQDLGRGACSAEGKAMGHCGNVPSQRHGDRVISLRKLVKHGNGTFVRPSLTFILHGDGYLGEMKGRANEKPKPQYHPYIVALLKNPIIKGIRGGGYAAENNFSINDLEEHVRDELVEAKPTLATLADYFKKHGFDDHVKKGVENALKQVGSEIEWADDNSYGIIEEFKDVDELIERYGDSNAKWGVRVLNGQDDLDSDAGYDDNGAEELLKELPNASIEKIGAYVKDTYADQIAQWEEDEGEEFDATDTDHIAHFLREEDDELWSELKRACNDGHRYGAEKQVVDAIEKTVLDFDPNEDIHVVFKSKDGSFSFGVPVLLTVPTKKLVDIATDDHKLASIEEEGWVYDKLQMREPSYGYNDYDEEGAIQSFFDNNPDYRAKTRKEERQEAEKKKAEELAAIDTTGWKVDATKSEWNGSKVWIHDPDGKVVSSRSGYYGKLDDATKDEMIRQTIWNQKNQK